MSIRVRIPTPLRAATDGEAELTSSAGNVAALIEELESLLGRRVEVIIARSLSPHFRPFV